LGYNKAVNTHSIREQISCGVRCHDVNVLTTSANQKWGITYQYYVVGKKYLELVLNTDIISCS